MKSREYNYFLIVFLTMLFVSNAASASVPIFGSNSESQFAREFTPPKGKAIIFIYQRKEDGRGVSPVIKLNNYLIGRLVPGSFTVWKLSAGQVTIKVRGIKTIGYSFKTKPGKIYRFRLIVTKTRTGDKADLLLMSTSARHDILGTRLLKNPRTVTTMTKRTQVAAPIPIASKRTQTVSPTTSRAKQASTSKPIVESAPEETLQTEYDDGDIATEKIAVMLKVGTLSLAATTQFIVATDRSFDDSSSPFGIEAYYQFSSGMTVGGELMQYTTNFTTVGLNDNHDVDVTLLMANVRQYFRRDTDLQIFIGVGLGSVKTDVSGPSVTSNASGLAYQLMGGVEYRFDNIGVFGEIKYIDAVSKSDDDEKIDVSGTGIFAGVVFHF